MKSILFVFSLFFSAALMAQPDRWQQSVKYVMTVDMNVETNQFKATQNLKYSNNSPDTLYKVFFTCIGMPFSPTA